MSKTKSKTDSTSESRTFQDELKESAHKIWLAGLGALSTAEEEGSKLFKGLVERGEQYENRGRERWEEVRDDVKEKVDEATGKAKKEADQVREKVEERVEEAVSGALKRAGVPTRDEIATLTKRVDELIATVEKMQSGQAKKTTAKTTKSAS